jgi:hypothetical protein
MYKTAIAHVEGQLSYDEALNNFRQSYPEYEVRGVKQSNFGWIAFIQKNALHNEEFEIPLGDESEMGAASSPGADESLELEEMEEPSAEEYGEEEEKQEGLLSELESALERVERLVSEIKNSEEEEDEVRPFDVEEEGPELMEEDEGFEKEFPMTIEREKEAGVTFTSATKEVEELIKTDKEFKNYRIASFEEEKDRFVAKLVRK